MTDTTDTDEKAKEWKNALRVKMQGLDCFTNKYDKLTENIKTLENFVGTLYAYASIRSGALELRIEDGLLDDIKEVINIHKAGLVTELTELIDTDLKEY